MTLSITGKRAVMAQETEQVFLVAVEINHEDLAEPIRVIANNENVTYDGHEFIAYAFDIVLPSDEEENPPVARITIDNVVRDIVNALRALNTPAEFTLRVLRCTDASDPSLEIEWTMFKLRNIDGDVFQISGDLTIEDITSEPFPYYTFNPQAFRGLFT